MGNIGSQAGNITTQKHNNDEQKWAHSFPRTQPRLYQQNKVLPERDARQKLRHTDNGEILQSGGTLSGRHQQNRLSLEIDGDDFDDFTKKTPKTYLPNQRDPLHKSGPRFIQNGFNHNIYPDNMKKFGSEPDLRHSQTNNQINDKDMRIKGKKKYKAPSPPQMVEKSEWDDINDDNSQMRKGRLFKTRAETKKTYSSPVNKHKAIENNDNNSNNNNNSVGNNEINDKIEIRENLDNFESRTNRLSLPEMKIADNFHQELREATKRLRQHRNSFINDDDDDDNKEKLKTLDHNFSKKDNIRQKLKDIHNEEKKLLATDVRCEGSGKESSSTDQISPILLRNDKNKNQPKQFYFGMDENRQGENYSNDIIDNFATNLHAMVHIPKINNSSESDISSEIEIDENQSGNGNNSIDLQLRPILPKKQLEIPRFSPAAAWRLLSVDSNPAIASTIASDDIPVFVEDKIEKYSRPPPPTMQIGPRSNDKSGDSGISGDAGPVGCYDDGPEIILDSRNHLQINSNGNRSQGISWTPQQDLGDDSSMEEGLNNENSLYRTREEPKYSNKPHVFSLSLPRDNHLSSYMADKTPYTSLQKLKRSVSGVLSSLSNKKDLLQLNLSHDQSDNWFLSKSAPNSLNNGFNSLEIKSSQKSDDNKDQLLVNSKHNSGRLMYLPEFDNSQDHRHIRAKNVDDVRERSKSAERSRKNLNDNNDNNNHNNINKLSIFSKSCENINNAEIKSSSEPEDLQDPKIVNDEKNWKNSKKPKRFTFQSTVRQIERKRLAEKLSREAERKEKQRLREVEAMQKVEEEFQKKRAREKATIRQQLRLFSMDDTSWNSTPSNGDVKDKIRPEPDGAVSSSTTSSPSLPPVHKVETKKVYQKNKKTTNGNLHKHRPSSDSSEDNKIKAPVTQILSEYRHPQREYKDYTSSARYLVEHDNVKHTTVHPQIICNMPKAKEQNSKANGTNYRKDFAHGVKGGTRSVGGSTYSEDSQSRNDSPRLYHSKYTPITRF